ncbi:MAG TPA: hypothetical protein VJ180_12580, partial [Pyrinomonadaceae bacterium]|nr:hypothetical protein [Pyrinomonadaceae bacterium]
MTTAKSKSRGAPHERVRTLMLLMAFVVLAIAPLGKVDSRSSAQEVSPRAPFSLELPDLGGLKITLPVASIPRANLRSLRLYINNPYAETIDYGKIYTAINGEAANTIQSIRSARDGKIITCDLESKPRFRLQPGKNVIEISAIDQDKRSFYASYVLIASGNALGEAVTNVTTETSVVETGPDRQPPTIYMLNPKNILRLNKETETLNVEGVVIDNSGSVD